MSSLNTPRSSALGRVVLHLLSPVLFYRRVVSSLRQMRPHVNPPSASRSWAPQAHPLHLFPLELFFSLAPALPWRPYLCLRSSLPFPLRFSRQSFWFVLDIRCCVVLPVFHTMPALHNPDNQQCDHQPRPSGILSSDVTFVVNFNSGYSICHGMSHKLFQFAVPCIVQWLSRPTLASHKVIFWQFSKLLLFDHDAYDSQVKLFSNCAEPNFFQIVPLAFFLSVPFVFVRSFFLIS